MASVADTTASKLGLCLECGKEMAPILAALGSLACHDCRKPANVVLRPRPVG
jgi:DNA-directed RNA polymerase subunit RPC12/RpoP